MTDTVIGDVPSGWAVLALGKACALGGGDVQTGPFGSQLHASDYVSTGVPSIMPVNIGDNRVIEEGISRVREADAERLARYRVRAGDIVYSRRGDVERRALITDREAGWLCGTGCLRVRFGEGHIDPAYASYYLGHPDVRAWVVRHAQGATMPNLNTSILAALPFVAPPIEVQRRIAGILGALDDKIELSRRLSETLQMTARALFRSWFVAGAGTEAEGWRSCTIGDLAEVVGGGTPSTLEPRFWNGSHYWATPKDLAGLKTPALLRTERMLTDAGIGQISSGLLPAGTVLMSSRAPIGYLAITEVPVAINQGFIAMKPRPGVSALFLLLWAASSQDQILSRANGSTFLEISKSSFRPIEVLAPPADAMASFDRVVRPIHERVVANERQIGVLAEIRDALLPRLLSGELTP